MNRRESMTNTRHNNTNDPQKKYRLGTVKESWKMIVHAILRMGIIRALNGSAGRPNFSAAVHSVAEKLG